MISVDIKNLPDEIDALKSIIANYHVNVKLLEEEIKVLTARLFGRKSEKLTPEDELQGRLFDEAENQSDTEAEKPERVQVKQHVRAKTGRKPLPPALPRVIIEHDITDDEKQCICGHTKTRIGSDESERLDIIPQKIQVIRHVVHKYACSHCEGVTGDAEAKAITTASLPPQMIPGGIASSGLIAYILTSKFCDALPFYRQEKLFARIGVELSRATMCNIAMATAGRLMRFYELMMEDILKSRHLGIDETTLQVLDEAGRKNTTLSYMWVFRGGTWDHPIIIFRYSPTRSSRAALPYLEDYTGIIQSDGYRAYDIISREGRYIHAGCMAHARRKFIDAMKATPGGKTQSYIDLIGKLYKVEDEIRSKSLTNDAIVAIRKKDALPVLEKIRKNLNIDKHQVAPGSTLGKAIRYMDEQWPKLLVYLDYGFCPIDNNLVENAIRPFVIGRKNWLFSGSPRGASASAVLYSIIETARANELEPYWYLRHLFAKLPLAQTDDDLRSLLPHRMNPTLIPRE